MVLASYEARAAFETGVVQVRQAGEGGEVLVRLSKHVGVRALDLTAKFEVH